jgi:hypothetical protein
MLVASLHKGFLIHSPITSANFTMSSILSFLTAERQEWVVILDCHLNEHAFDILGNFKKNKPQKEKAW